MQREPVRQLMLCIYFEGGDADGTYDRRPVDPESDIIRGPASSLSTYERTERTIRGNGGTWHVWTHHGDWRPYRPVTAP